MAFEEIKTALEDYIKANPVEPFNFEFSEESIAGLDRADRAYRLRNNPYSETAGLKADAEPEQLAAVAALISDEAIHRASKEARLMVQFDDEGRALGIANEYCGDAIMGFIYRAIAYRGASARLTAEDREELARTGRSPTEIDAIHRLLRDAAARETKMSWALGPERMEIQDVLAKAGIQPLIEHVHVVRRIVLLRRADLLNALALKPRLDIYHRATATVAVNAPGADSPIKSDAPVPPLAATAAIVETISHPQETTVEDRNEDSDATTFTGLTESLIARRLKLKQMGEHSARQYRFIGDLFVKSAGTNDPRQMTQRHIGAFFDLLPRLPKSHHKSPGDKDRTFEEIIARAEKKIAKTGQRREEVFGLDAPTINRYVTQLHVILKYARGRGFVIGDIDTLDDMRERDPERDEDKRVGFDSASSIKLFSSGPWGGCASEDERLKPGNIIIHDSLFFTPLLACYGLMSLSEATRIVLDDVDLEKAIAAIEIRTNILRDHTKTDTRTRRQPLHDEIMRLGFEDYVKELRRLGFKTLFPDLILRGQATDLGDLFDKVWAPALDNALPHAREQKMTLHSWRKAGNTCLTRKHAEVSMPLRYQIMGHALKDVNGKHYTEQLPDSDKLQALRLLPIVTAHLKSAPIRLAQSVLEFARDVPVQKRTFLI